jgi:hypothetical protein
MGNSHQAPGLLLLLLLIAFHSSAHIPREIACRVCANSRSSAQFRPRATTNIYLDISAGIARVCACDMGDLPPYLLTCFGARKLKLTLCALRAHTLLAFILSASRPSPTYTPTPAVANASSSPSAIASRCRRKGASVHGCRAPFCWLLCRSSRREMSAREISASHLPCSCSSERPALPASARRTSGLVLRR